MSIQKRRYWPILVCVILLVLLCHPAVAPCAGSAEETTLCLQTLMNFGWEVDSEPISVEPVTLSLGADDPYLRLQTQAGFDLTSVLGRTVTRYTFLIRNYPTGEAGIYADVLVLDGRVVGGDVRCTALNGFLHSLVYPA